MKDSKTVFRWYWAWDDEKEEQWLNEQARQGWHLKAPGTLGMYSFEPGNPCDVIYRLDFKTAQQDMDAYLQIFADAGWEYLGAMGGWQYFRKEHVEGEVAEIYTDNTSKIQKYQRLIMFLVILLPVYMFLLINVATISDLTGFWGGLTTGLSIAAAALMLIYVYAMIRIIRRINALKT